MAEEYAKELEDAKDAISNAEDALFEGLLNLLRTQYKDTCTQSEERESMLDRLSESGLYISIYLGETRELKDAVERLQDIQSTERERIREEVAGFTQRAAACHLGMSVSSFSRYERFGFSSRPNKNGRHYNQWLKTYGYTE